MEKRPFQFASGDLDILKIIYQLRLATIDHLIALTGRKQEALIRRLLKLLDHSHISRIKRPFQKHIYAIGREAIPLLVRQGIAPKELIDQRLRTSELKDLFLQHRLMLSDIHTALMLATKNSAIKLNQWREGQELYDYINVEGETLPVRPDAFFILKDTRRPEGQNRACFFLEADRSSTTHKRFQRKIRAYQEYALSGKFAKKYNFKYFITITITLTKERAINLCEAVREILTREKAQKFFFFSPITKFSLTNPHRILNNIFFTPRDYQRQRYYLVKPLVEPQQQIS